MRKARTARMMIVEELKDLLLKGNAHATLEDALKDVPEAIRGQVPDKLPYSIWQVAEHIRAAQWDILDFCRNPDYVAKPWPDAYWHKKSGPEHKDDWDNCIKSIIKDRQDFIGLLEAGAVDLFTPFPWGEGQNLFREAVLIADHNSYHTGEIIVLRRLLGAWK